MPHAAHDLHGGRPPARPQHARAAARPVGHARRAQRLQPVPHEAGRKVGGGCGAPLARARRHGIPGVRGDFHAGRGRDRRARRRSLATIANDLATSNVRASAVERLAQAGSGDASTAHARHAMRSRCCGSPPYSSSSYCHRRSSCACCATVFDPLRAVRIEAARAAGRATGRPPAERRAAWQQAADEYIATLHYTADRPEARTALGTFHRGCAGTTRPRPHLRSIALDPRHVPAYLNAADALRAGRDADARRMLELGWRRAPKNAALHDALGADAGPPRPSKGGGSVRCERAAGSNQTSRATPMSMPRP